MTQQEKIYTVIADDISRDIRRLEELKSILRRWTKIDVSKLNVAINILYGLLPEIPLPKEE